MILREKIQNIKEVGAKMWKGIKENQKSLRGVLVAVWIIAGAYEIYQRNFNLSEKEVTVSEKNVLKSANTYHRQTESRESYDWFPTSTKDAQVINKTTRSEKYIDQWTKLVPIDHKLQKWEKLIETNLWELNDRKRISYKVEKTRAVYEFTIFKKVNVWKETVWAESIENLPNLPTKNNWLEYWDSTISFKFCVVDENEISKCLRSTDGELNNFEVWDKAKWVFNARWNLKEIITGN